MESIRTALLCWIVPAGLPPGFAATIPDLAPDMDRGADVVNAHSPPAGEAAATTRLAQFISRSADYVAGRDRLDKQMAGSGLSDALAVGEISPRTVWAAAQDIACDPEHAPAAEKFMSELLWRDFAWSLLIEAPWMESKTWNPRFVGFPWREVREDLTAWQRGQTGEPLVDAGMRELFVTGRMHNRARMAAASYLTKHLLIDWRAGLDWFADTLIDWDPASNATNWQWVAGSGPDASPFFRIFNPATQAEKFDPDGVYRRRWLYGWQGSKSDGARAFFDAALGVATGPSEAETFWTEFLRSLADRGLRGVKLVIADDHKGLRAAARRVFNATHQRCRIHWMRNALAHAPAKQRTAVAAMLKTIFAQETRAEAEAQWEIVADALREKQPKLGALMDASRDDVLAYMSFPREYWTQIASTNPLERVNREVKRRADVIGIFPNDEAIIRLVGALMLETNDEWAVARRYMTLETLGRVTENPTVRLPAVAT